MRKILIYTVHKAASMFLHQLSCEISEELNVDYLSINNKEDYDSILNNSWLSYISDDSRQGIFGPIRAFEAVPNIPDDTVLDNYSIVLHLRDPRDVLTSLYYSQVYSHPRKPGAFNPSVEEIESWVEEGIDKFVLERAGFIQTRYHELCSRLLNRSNVNFVRYETMVTSYSHWLVRFLSSFSELIPSVDDFTSLYCKLYDRHHSDFDVDAEDVYRHKRQVKPGDHNRKLKANTIEKLNVEFQSILNMLGYQDD